MKKFLCLIGILGICVSPATAKNIPYVTNIPYKPYTKEIKLNKIDSQTMQNDFVSIAKNKFEFKYVSKMGYAYEYNITNDTENDIILKGVNSFDFYNEDLSDKSNKPFKNLTKTAFTTKQIYIPIYGIYYGARCDLEKNSFLRDFPENKTIKSGESIRILASATKDKKNPQAEFIVVVNDQEQKISF